MEILENIPFIIFNLVFFVIFLAFVFGSFVLLFGRAEQKKRERGENIILKSLYALLVLLIIVLVFFLVSYWVRKGQALRPPPASKEFPSPPFSVFPPGPEFSLPENEQYDIINNKQ